MIIMAHRSSKLFVGRISPYPTVVQVTVAQYSDTMYLDSNGASSNPLVVTQFTFE
jgi:hypothetical protein